MRFLFLLSVAVAFSSGLFAQNTDTTKVATDTSKLSTKVTVPISIQVQDTVGAKAIVPVVASDSVKANAVKPEPRTDSVAVPKAAAAGTTAKEKVENPVDTTSVKASAPAAAVPAEPLDPNYVYSTLMPGLPLVKKNNTAKTDTIVMLNGDKILANVKKFTFKDLFYGFPGDQKMVQVDRRYVQKIIYKFGRVEMVTSHEVEVREVGGWRDVKVLKKRTPALDEMIELGVVEGKDDGESGKYVDARDLERSATITLQKKAALLGATVVLITNRDVRRPYGDVPTVTLTGKAYKPK